MIHKKKLGSQPVVDVEKFKIISNNGNLVNMKNYCKNVYDPTTESNHLPFQFNAQITYPLIYAELQILSKTMKNT